MEKFLVYIFSILIILLGVPNMATCVNYALDRSGVVGSKGELEKNDLATQDLKGYSITYNLDGGTLIKVNPDYYTLFSEDFTLNNPTKDGFEFLGWTGSNGEEPQLTVTICKGSAGDLEFTANYVPLLDAPEVELIGETVAWNAIEHADNYKLSLNDNEYELGQVLEVDLKLYKSSLINGANKIKVKACSNDIIDNSSEYSNPVYYTAVQLTMPYITIDSTTVSWTKTNNADYYLVEICGIEAENIKTFTTSELSFDLNNYSNLLAADQQYFVKITACSNLTTYLNSQTASDIFTFASTKDFSNLTELSVQNKVILIDKLENSEHIGILNLQLQDIDGNIWQFRTTGSIYSTYSECEDDFDIYKLNTTTNEFEKTYTTLADQLEFLNNTKFYFGNDKYFMFINYEPSVYENVVYCFSRYFAQSFISRADDRLVRTKALEFENSYECTEEYTYTTSYIDVFALIEFYSTSTNEIVEFEDTIKISVTDYGLTE